MPDGIGFGWYEVLPSAHNRSYLQKRLYSTYRQRNTAYRQSADGLSCRPDDVVRQPLLYGGPSHAVAGIKSHVMSFEADLGCKVHNKLWLCSWQTYVGYDVSDRSKGGTHSKSVSLH